LVLSLGAAGQTALVPKRLTAIDGLGIDGAAFALIEKLARGSATLADVAAWEPLIARAARLAAIGGGLDPARFVLHLDDVDEGSGYYTGIRFRVFDADSRARIAQG